jgi:hypothetical protein
VRATGKARRRRLWLLIEGELALLVRGKGHDRLIYLHQDVGPAVNAYLKARGQVLLDALAYSS